MFPFPCLHTVSADSAAKTFLIRHLYVIKKIYIIQWLQKRMATFHTHCKHQTSQAAFSFSTCQWTCVQSIGNLCATCKVEYRSNVSYLPPPSLRVSAYDLRTCSHTSCRIALPSLHCCHFGSEMGGDTTKHVAVLMMTSRRSNHVKYQLNARCHRCQLHYHSWMDWTREHIWCEPQRIRLYGECDARRSTSESYP